MRARDIMTTPTIAVTPSATLEEAAKVMAANRFTTLPVVTPSGELVGLLAEADIIQAPGPAGDPDTGAMLGGQVRTAGAAMRRSGFGVVPDTEVSDLAGRMSDAGMRSAPVIEGGRVVGMVTLADVLRALGGPARTRERSGRFY